MTLPGQSDARRFPAPETAGARRIVLTGFMGSGKSTAGPLLAARLGWRFVDVDDVIEADAGMKIAEIFARHGEAAFREQERATIARLAAEDGLVLALGGGAIESAETRELLLNGAGTLLVHLEVDLATTLARCGGTEQTRPVLADQANLARRYERRLPLYRMAHVSIKTDALTPEEVVEAVVGKMPFEQRQKLAQARLGKEFTGMAQSPASRKGPRVSDKSAR